MRLCFILLFIVSFIVICLYDWLFHNKYINELNIRLKKNHKRTAIILKNIYLASSFTIPVFISKTHLCEGFERIYNSLSSTNTWIYFIPATIGSAMGFFIQGLLLNVIILYIYQWNHIISIISYVILITIVIIVTIIYSDWIDSIGFLIGDGMDFLLFLMIIDPDIAKYLFKLIKGFNNKN